ncbi:hypothetical protein BT96DRAFT_639811 [Gymnopus androsaceus JB14]|uniref:Uncharacterized protein n=1 Tax=Gymnopus androsaceus JB14 TaxID=1447944 RepID=A0A6A4HRW7_9AGAR|nr:hypothetical protein BT96DRAFT_639811 [Gymnopus androsaceus JB14]
MAILHINSRAFRNFILSSLPSLSHLVPLSMPAFLLIALHATFKSVMLGQVLLPQAACYTSITSKTHANSFKILLTEWLLVQKRAASLFGCMYSL